MGWFSKTAPATAAPRKTVTLQSPPESAKEGYPPLDDENNLGKPRSSFAARKSHIGKRGTIYERHHPEEEQHVAFYRHYDQQLPVAIQAHTKFFPWPPKRFIYISSGYYKTWYDMSLYTEVTSFETDTLRVHNVPDEVTEEKMRSEFKGDPAVLLGQPSYIKYPDEDEARDAFKESKHVKIAQGDLLYLKGNDFYVTNIPPNTNTDHIKHLYPNADEVKVVHNGPGGRSYAYVHYPDEEERDADFNNGPLPIGPGDTIDGTDALRREKVIRKSPQPSPNHIWVMGIPKKGTKPEDLNRFFPNNQGITFKKHKGLRNLIGGTGKLAVIQYDTPEEATQAAHRATPKYFRNVGPRQFQLVRRPPSSKDITEEELDHMTDEDLAKNLWSVPQDSQTTVTETFIPTVTLTGLPKGTTRSTVEEWFPEATEIDMKKEKKHMTATMTFRDPVAAAAAFTRARKLGVGEVHAETPSSERRKSRKSIRRIIRRTIIRRSIHRKPSDTRSTRSRKSRTSIRRRKSKKSIKSSSETPSEKTTRKSVGGKSRKSVTKRKKSVSRRPTKIVVVETKEEG